MYFFMVKINLEYIFEDIEVFEKDFFLWGVEWFCGYYFKYVSKEVLYVGLLKSDKLEFEMVLCMFEQMGIFVGWVKCDLNLFFFWLFFLFIVCKDGIYCIFIVCKGKCG